MWRNEKEWKEERRRKSVGRRTEIRKEWFVLEFFWVNDSDRAQIAQRKKRRMVQ